MAATSLQAGGAASSTMVVQASPVQAQAIQRAPISQLIPILKTVYSTSLVLVNFSLSLAKPLLVLSPIPILLYVFAPLIVFAQLVLSVFVLSPYRIAVYLLDALYPLYVLCGVACIVGGIIGLLARTLSKVLVQSALAERKGVEDDEDKKVVKLKSEEEDSEQVDVKGKGKKVDSPRVKFES